MRVAQPFHHGFAFHLNQADPSKPSYGGSTPPGSVQEPQHEQKPKERGEGWPQTLASSRQKNK